MRIEILGTGCYNCLKLDLLVTEVLQDLGQHNVEIVRVDDERQIRKFMPLDAIPGLVIDGLLVSRGEVPSRETLRHWFEVHPEPH